MTDRLQINLALWDASRAGTPAGRGFRYQDAVSVTIVENDGTEKLADVNIPIGRFVELENERMGEDPAYGPPPGNPVEP